MRGSSLEVLSVFFHSSLLPMSGLKHSELMLQDEVLAHSDCPDPKGLQKAVLIDSHTATGSRNWGAGGRGQHMPGLRGQHADPGWWLLLLCPNPLCLYQHCKAQMWPLLGLQEPRNQTTLQDPGLSILHASGDPPWAVLCLNRSHLKIWCPRACPRSGRKLVMEPGIGSSFPSHLPSLLLQPSAHTHPMPFLTVRP